MFLASCYQSLTPLSMEDPTSLSHWLKGKDISFRLLHMIQSVPFSSAPSLLPSGFTHVTTYQLTCIKLLGV